MRELSLLNCRLDKRYDVARELGRGSYAEIFVAHDTMSAPHSPHSTVVIKALNVFLQDDLDADLERTLVENFQNEALALDRVRHPNIIGRLGHGTARDLAGTMFHYLVLEYLAGGDLQKASREKTLSLRTALAYIEQVCAGLRHAHKNGIIHRDIKPQNLLLTADRETVKIADFGVARVHQSDSPITRVGTNVYAPPEHSPMFAGDTAVITVASLTPAADIYSLAKTVYTLITGEAPRFYANQPITDLPITSRDKEWTPELKRVLRKATASRASERHQSVDEFWTDLEAVRKIAAGAEPSARLSAPLHDKPQPHISVGYSPMTPQKPRFDTSRELKLRHPYVPRESSVEHIAFQDTQNEVRPIERVEDYWPNSIPADQLHSVDAIVEEIAVKPKKKRRFVRRLGTFAMLLFIFAAGLYGTSVYLRARGILPQISNPFAEQLGHANTDINLRPSPNANNDPIGLVTRNSKVRIVKSQNNWYQVDVLEQGRPRDEQLATTRGWLNGKYVDLD
ncbi:MAG: protein kinase domain-containing protein [Pyrinomonadaceae bacterium]